MKHRWCYRFQWPFEDTALQLATGFVSRPVVPSWKTSNLKMSSAEYISVHVSSPWKEPLQEGSGKGWCRITKLSNRFGKFSRHIFMLINIQACLNNNKSAVLSDYFNRKTTDASYFFIQWSQHFDHIFTRSSNTSNCWMWQLTIETHKYIIMLHIVYYYA